MKAWLKHSKSDREWPVIDQIRRGAIRTEEVVRKPAGTIQEPKKNKRAGPMTAIDAIFPSNLSGVGLVLNIGCVSLKRVT